MWRQCDAACRLVPTHCKCQFVLGAFRPVLCVRGAVVSDLLRNGAVAQEEKANKVWISLNKALGPLMLSSCSARTGAMMQRALRAACRAASKLENAHLAVRACPSVPK